MAQNDIKGVKENAGGTYDEVLLNNNGIFPTAPEILVIKQLTAVQYAALTPKVNTTLYIIVG